MSFFAVLFRGMDVIEVVPSSLRNLGITVVHLLLTLERRL
jgi:hypothetical protein